jgi:hypothetical protein
MIYTDTNYITQCRYLCNVISFLLHAHKFRMTKKCVLKENKLVCMEAKKS